MEAYKILLNAVKEKLSESGFTKADSTFYMKKDNNWGLINFQKSRSSMPGEIKFTINIGISSSSIRSFLGGKIESKPEIEDCHWRNRAGFLLPKREDHWWIMNSDTNIESLCAEVEDVMLNYCVPELNNYISDQSLEKIWLKGISAGIGELQRYIYLTSLLKIYKRSNLVDVAKRLKEFSSEKPFEDVAEKHLRKLEIGL